MRSTCDTIPTHRKVVEGIDLPIAISIDPLSEHGLVIKKEDIPPRCERCSAYFNGECGLNDYEWACLTCTQLNKFKTPVKSEIKNSNVIEIIEEEESVPLIHSIIAFTPVRDVVKKCLSLLPKNTPIQLITYTDKKNTNNATLPDILAEEIDSFPFPENPVPFETAARVLINSIRGSNNQACWHRVFIASPPSDIEDHEILGFFSDLIHEKDNTGISTQNIRVDLFLHGMGYSPFLDKLVHQTPGLARVYAPMTEDDMPRAFLADTQIEFAFHCFGKLNTGVATTNQYIPSAYISSAIEKDHVSIPVLPSNTSSLVFKLLLPSEEPLMGAQAFQAVVKYNRWNPKTNKIAQIRRIITHRFELSYKLKNVLDSINPGELFYFWMREITKLPPAKQTDEVISRMKAFSSVVAQDPERLRPLVEMAFLAKSHPVLSTAFWDRITAGAMISLTSSSATASLFGYRVEAYENGVKLEEGLTATPRKGRVYLVKSFPSVFVLSEEGKVDLSPSMKESIDNFTKKCAPIPVTVDQCELSSVPALLSVDEEEGLTEFLEKVGLQSVKLFVSKE